MRTIKCPLCDEVMIQKEAHGSTFWECPTCRAEFWPAAEDFKKIVKELMQPPVPISKKGSGGRRKSRHKSKKPGEKFIPWYRR